MGTRKERSVVKAIILDFYGVLYSNFDWGVIDERIKPFADKAGQFEELKNRSNRGEITNKDLQSAVAELAGDAAQSKRPAVYGEPYFNKELMDFLRINFPKLKLAVLSGGNARDVHAELEHNGTMGLLSAVITSSESNYQKPQREAYEEMFLKLGVKPEETLIIDDSQRYVDAARSYGFNAIHYFEEIDFEAEFKRFLTW